MEIKLFSFQDKEVRTFLQGRDVWFVAQDVYKALGMAWKGGNNIRSDKKVPESWLMTWGLPTSGGLQNHLFINEQGLYKIIFSSKPKDPKVSEKVDEFINWVVGLLVQIRKGNAKVTFVGNTPEDHLDVSVQKQNSKAINAKMFFDGDVEAIKAHNTTNCKVHTGMTPREVKEVGKNMGLKSVDRTSAKEVIRHLKPEIAASMSMADRLAGEKGIDSGKAAKICKDYALPLFDQLKKLGALTILLSALLLSSCSLFTDTEYRIHAEIQPFVDEFYQEAHKRGKNPQSSNLIFIIQKDLLKDTGGLGATKTEKGGWGADPQIRCYIDEDYFYSADSLCVKSTVFHELGHALLKRTHNNTWSIMNSGVKCFGRKEENEKLLIDELFH